MMYWQYYHQGSQFVEFLINLNVIKSIRDGNNTETNLEISSVVGKLPDEASKKLSIILEGLKLPKIQHAKIVGTFKFRDFEYEQTAATLVGKLSAEEREDKRREDQLQGDELKEISCRRISYRRISCRRISSRRTSSRLISCRGTNHRRIN
ncbi:hypothetical protein TrRE_jg10276 [Triparma retinervis]|uniref:Uncharacterized protein n=1 Tax=Triparma retinervis TaxID=2557542 RepID=A0A9W7DYB8_9STRA|nr:hypothetical protein TrRE_jg10276 [Triparma retinervis]